VGALASPLHGAPQVFVTGRSTPGFGAATVQAIGYDNLPMIQGVVLFAAFVVIIANLLIEIAYAALDRESVRPKA
jgi:peptide/nickel transport system permease protein